MSEQATQAEINQAAFFLTSQSVYAPAVATLLDYFNRQILATQPQEVEVREENYRLFLVLDSLNKCILKWANNHKKAEDDEKRRQEDKKRLQLERKV